jgi:hypothetical protein
MQKQNLKYSGRGDKVQDNEEECWDFIDPIRCLYGNLGCMPWSFNHYWGFISDK